MTYSFTSTVNVIPNEIDTLKNSGLSFAINVIMEKFSGENVPLITDEIIRCVKCKTYLNPYVEIYPPGNLWKCNICFTTNKTDLPLVSRQGYSQSNMFLPFQNRINNYKASTTLDLKHLKIDVLAPPSFYSKPATDPLFFFLIEATNFSINNGMFTSVLSNITNNLSMIPNASGRTKIIISFFNSEVYILKKGESNNFAIISDFTELPTFFSEDFIFKTDEVNLEIEKLKEFFTSKNDKINNLGGALNVMNKIISGGGTSLLFLSSVPNEGLGKIETDKGNLKCKNNFYKSITGEFTMKQTALNLFLFPTANLELPTLSILSKFTGGCIFYYPNYNSNNPLYNSRFVSDFSTFFEQNLGLEAVCKVRVPEGIKINEYYGNMVLRSDGIISFSNFNPGHSFTFELEITDSYKQTDLTIQIALLKTLINGEKIIRILNIAIPHESSLQNYEETVLFEQNVFRNTSTFTGPHLFYDFANSNAIVHHAALKSIYKETIQKGNGNVYLSNFLKRLSKSFKKLINIKHTTFVLPERLNDLPLKVLSLMKSIPLRPSIYTPMDFKAYYFYLIYTQYPNFISKLILPELYAIHTLGENEGLFVDDKLIMPCPVRLTLDCLETNGFYLLNTGVNFYFFIGKDCDPEFSYQAIGDAAGPFLLTKYDNEVSHRLNNIISNLWSDRFISPGYYAVRDNGQPSVLMDIFFGYFVEDSVHGLPDINGFLSNLTDE